MNKSTNSDPVQRILTAEREAQKIHEDSAIHIAQLNERLNEEKEAIQAESNQKLEEYKKDLERKLQNKLAVETELLQKDLETFKKESRVHMEDRQDEIVSLIVQEVLNKYGRS